MTDLPTPTTGPTPPEKRDGRPISRKDRKRLIEFRRRVLAGEDQQAAWGAMLRSEEFGYMDTIRKRKLDEERIAASLANFLARVTPGGVAEAQRATQAHFAAHAEQVARTVTDIAATGGTKDEDPAVTRNRLYAASKALDRIDEAAGPKAPTVAVQNNVSVALGRFADRIASMNGTIGHEGESA